MMTPLHRPIAARFTSTRDISGHVPHQAPVSIPDNPATPDLLAIYLVNFTNSHGFDLRLDAHPVTYVVLKGGRRFVALPLFFASAAAAIAVPCSLIYMLVCLFTDLPAFIGLWHVGILAVFAFVALCIVAIIKERLDLHEYRIRLAYYQRLQSLYLLVSAQK